MALRSKILGLWDDLRSSFWFFPSIMALGSILASQICLRFDRSLGSTMLTSALLYTGSADGARSILSTIASSMIGLGGVVFSMTLVTLSLAAQQFGARTLRSLVRDRGNQTVLGVFISAFLFCILVLRQVRGPDEGGGAFVPQISMFVALLLALSGLVVLIYFIHHISSAIQAPHVISEAGADLVREVGEEASGDWKIELDPKETEKCELSYRDHICADRAGYIRRIDYSRLSNIASEENVFFELTKRSGDFVVSGEVLFTIHSLRGLSPMSATEFDARESFSFGSQRTQEQDLRFMIGQLLSIALLALSPAVNNPVQAMLCIDRLTEALNRFAQMPQRGNFLFGKSGRVAVIDRALSFADLFTLSFREIRLNSKTQLMVSLALLDAYRRLYMLNDVMNIRDTIETDYQKLYAQTYETFADEMNHVPKTCIV